jgi:RimJ/RimL family protein N-acetyltransferase
VTSRLFTQSLMLRPIERADLGVLAGWYADPDVMRHIGDGRVYGRVETEIALHRHLDEAARTGFGLMIAELLATGEAVGRCGFKVWEIDGVEHVEIGWLIATAHQGRGYATEAGEALKRHGFGRLGQRSLISVIQPANRASIRVAEKLGGFWWRDWVTPGGADVSLYRYERAADPSVGAGLDELRSQRRHQV